MQYLEELGRITKLEVEEIFPTILRQGGLGTAKVIKSHYVPCFL